MKTQLLNATAVILLLLAMADSSADTSVTYPAYNAGSGRISLTLDRKQRPVVAYFDSRERRYKVMHCNDVRCTGGDESITTIPLPYPRRDEGFPPIPGVLLALDSLGNPVIVTSGLYVAKCTTPDCSRGTGITRPASVGTVLDLALDSHDNPAILYSVRTTPGEPDENVVLRLMQCNDPNCIGGDESISSAILPTTSLERARAGGGSLALDSDGFPIVFYSESFPDPPFNLTAVRCFAPICADGPVSVQGIDLRGLYPSQAMNHSGYSTVAYLRDEFPNETLGILYCLDAACASRRRNLITFPDPTERAGTWPTLQLDSAGNPVVLYQSNLSPSGIALRLLRCNDPECGGNDESFSSPDFGPGQAYIDSHRHLALSGGTTPVMAVSYILDPGDTASPSFLAIMVCDDPNCSSESNFEPEADAGGPYFGLQGLPISVDGSGSNDPDGDPTTFAWSDDSFACGFDNDMVASTLFTCSRGGSFRVRLVVTDDGGLSDRATAVVEVISREAAVEILREDLKELFDIDILTIAQRRFLDRPLKNAIKDLRKNLFPNADAHMQQFIGNVQQSTPQPLDQKTATLLIDRAVLIRKSIASELPPK